MEDKKKDLLKSQLHIFSLQDEHGVFIFDNKEN
jgi:hypothetical protein